MNTDIRRATVCFIRNKGTILLALIEYKPGKQLWNGIGGWAEVGETLEHAVVREVTEETFIELDKIRLTKVVEFSGENHLNVFLADSYGGELKIKDPSLKELKWFTISEIPYSQMFPGVDTWLPKVLAGKLLKDTGNGLIEFTSDQTNK